MSTDVKRRGSHDGRGGQARTRLARAVVIEAARALFLDRGYAGTTIENISDRSDVPPATVYRLFASKLGILKALIEVSIAGDDEAVALVDRPHIRALVADSDPRNQLAGLAGLIRGIMSRGEPLHRILVSAAGSDPDAAALLAELMRQRQHGHARIVSSLARSGALRPGLRERDADDIIHALTSPEVYGLLVRDRGWPPGRYEQWLTDILVNQLLPPPTTANAQAKL